MYFIVLTPSSKANMSCAKGFLFAIITSAHQIITVYSNQYAFNLTYTHTVTHTQTRSHIVHTHVGL